MICLELRHIIQCKSEETNIFHIQIGRELVAGI